MDLLFRPEQLLFALDVHSSLRTDLLTPGAVFCRSCAGFAGLWFIFTRPDEVSMVYPAGDSGVCHCYGRVHCKARRKPGATPIGICSVRSNSPLGRCRVSRIRLIKPVEPEIESAAGLAKLASNDHHGIIAYPEHLEMTVKFYSGRRLCTDPVLSKLSHNANTECEPSEAAHMILRTTERTTVESRFEINPLLEDGPLTYASIARR